MPNISLGLHSLYHPLWTKTVISFKNYRTTFEEILQTFYPLSCKVHIQIKPPNFELYL